MKLYIGHDPVKGRGVFCSEDLEAESLVEICELIFLKPEEIPESLEGYVYQYSKTLVGLALGNGSLYNHSDRPNCIFEFNYRKRLLSIKTRVKIKANKELTINYGYDKSQKRKFRIA